MNAKTLGIVLHSIKYSDSSNIISVFTKDFGRVSYIVYGAHKKKSSVRSSFFQPLSIVEMEVTHSPGRDLHRIKEIKMVHLFTEIPYHPVKNALALFLSEVLYRTLKQDDVDESLFLFLENSIQQLDYCERGMANFHLVFLMKLTRYLGFAPNDDGREFRYFDLINGVFLQERPNHNHFILPEVAKYFYSVLHTDYSVLDSLIMSREARVEIVEILIEYYRLHLPDFHGVQSIDVLQSLFD